MNASRKHCRTQGRERLRRLRPASSEMTDRNPARAAGSTASSSCKPRSLLLTCSDVAWHVRQGTGAMHDGVGPPKPRPSNLTSPASAFVRLRSSNTTPTPTGHGSIADRRAQSGAVWSLLATCAPLGVFYDLDNLVSQVSVMSARERVCIGSGYLSVNCYQGEKRHILLAVPGAMGVADNLSLYA
ncbi:hypothetical protein PYCCODRAFT_1126724 [Trametes coccinea BRFM310]|uniref:Uncharacterized protein n=1 Tax=Trametes coccinea (strain BRFM310) TaxID=1353009 RepID=A0A1Y2I8Z5_TRAC3|nr:hypothetical protein PYCCODRAFT_1126724 [Trametes coccinea BRFM310]